MKTYNDDDDPNTANDASPKLVELVEPPSVESAETGDKASDQDAQPCKIIWHEFKTATLT